MKDVPGWEVGFLSLTSFFARYPRRAEDSVVGRVKPRGPQVYHHQLPQQEQGLLPPTRLDRRTFVVIVNVPFTKTDMIHIQVGKSSYNTARYTPNTIVVL